MLRGLGPTVQGGCPTPVAMGLLPRPPRLEVTRRLVLLALRPMREGLLVPWPFRLQEPEQVS